MNAKDLKIIIQLRQNARMPLTKMSKKTGIPVSTIFDRLKINQESLIVKHTTLIDFDKLGYHTRAQIMIKVDREDKETFKDFIIRHHAINSVCKTNNGFDFMLEGIFKEIRDMEEFIGMLEEKFNVKDTKSFFVVEDLKKEGFMSNPGWVF